MSRRKNKFPSWCSDCRQAVPAGGGYLHGKDDVTGRWRIVCKKCGRGRRGAAYAGSPRDATSWPWSAPVPLCLRTLGLAPPAGREAVKRRFRALAMACHPDHGGDACAFMAIESAYREAMSLAGGYRP